MVRKKVLTAAAAVVLGVGLTVSPALAKCGKDCKSTLVTEFHTCKAACATGKAGKDCRKACKTDFHADKKACKQATNPTPPGCSPSGAFLDAYDSF
jgi:hypothetical protein